MTFLTESRPGTALVTGAAGGLGYWISEYLMAMKWDVIHYDLSSGCDVRNPGGRGLREPPHTLDVLINCAGVNMINWLPDVTEDEWDLVMDTNAKGIFRMTQWCLPALTRSKGTILNIVSNASHMPMRCSLAYNASKGAAHIMTLQLARELFQRYGITVFGISPNKLAETGMSDDIDRQVMKTRGWSRDEAREYQLKGLAIGEETDPEQLAEFIAFLLSTKHRHKYLHGCILPYGA